MRALAHILLEVILPGLCLMALGALLHRRKTLNLDTLVKINLYAFVPGFLLVRVAESRFTWATVALTGVATILPMLAVGLLTHFVLRILGLRGPAQSAAVAGAVFFNAGNFGIPVAQLAFGDTGGEVQALSVLYLNTLVFFAGYLLLASDKTGGFRGALRAYFRLPMFYVIAVGFVLRETGWVDPEPPPALAWIWTAARFMAGGMVPVALITLGAQIGGRMPWPRWRVTGPVLAMKLLVLPAVTGVVVVWLDLWPWPGAQLILAAAAPTAVNTLLLAMEVGADAEDIAGCVFWTTLLSVATVAPVLFVLRLLAGDTLPTP